MRLECMRLSARQGERSHGSFRPRPSSRGSRSRLGASLAAMLVLAALATPSLLAQQTVTLQGRVTDAEAQPVSGAQLSVRNVETGRERGTLTQENGTFSIVGLEPGPYEVDVTMLGYGQAQRSIELLLGQRAVLDITLETAALALEGIQVRAPEEGTFEVQRTDVSAPVVQTEIANLPLNTRNAVNLATIVPGVKTYAPTAGRSLPSSGSLADLRFWNFYLEGAEWKSMFNGNLVGIPQTGSPMPQEALREFRVQINPYDAEYTRGASYIISAVTHRGTNDFHGSGFIYGQNNNLRALDYFQREAQSENPDGFSRADYDRQQLGFNLRGPLVRDRLFFSLSYELNNTDDTIDVVPGSERWSEYGGTFTAPTKNHTGLLRLTAPAGDRHTLDAIWAVRSYDSETHYGSAIARDGGINARYTVHSLQLRDTYTPSSSLVNELSFHLLSWDHDESPLLPGPQLGYPGIQIGRNNFPLQLKETHLRAINKLTYTPPGGRHLVKAGVEVSRIRTDSFRPLAQHGSFVFPTDTSSLPLRATIGVGYFDPHRHRVVSNSCCTTYCLAAMLHPLHQAYGVIRGAAAIAYAHGSRPGPLLDGVFPNLRMARANASNLVPANIPGVRHALDRVIPGLAGQISATAIRVPVQAVSAATLTLRVSQPVNPAEVNSSLQAASSSLLKGYLEVGTDPLVSSDVLGAPVSCVVDPYLTTCLDDLVRVVVDSETGGGLDDLLGVAVQEAGFPLLCPIWSEWKIPSRGICTHVGRLLSSYPSS
jgi:hypothetical protein